MDRKEKIFLYISSKEYTPLTFEELKISLDVPNEDLPQFFSILEELIFEGKIFLSKNKRYALASKNNLFSGIISTNPKTHSGFVRCENFEDDIFVAPENLKTALDKDTVLVKITGTYKGRKEGVVQKILKRGNDTISAVIKEDFYAVADNPKITNKINLTDIQDAKIGDRVLLSITDYAKDGTIFASLISVLGSANDIKTLEDAIIYEHHINQKFDEATILEAKSFTDKILAKDFPDRVDLTDEIIFTIDGDDAKDFDDAISLKILDNNNFLLGVHIADVTHYVTDGSSLDSEAYSRGTSVYLPNKVIPMLPFELSDNLCSLMPKVNRLALTLIMEIDAFGKVISHKLQKSVIKSCERMTYNDVAKILNFDRALSEKYAHIVPTLMNMARLFKILSQKRKARGSIDFDFPESKVIVDSSGLPSDVIKVERNDAHRLIEEFMLVANETVAELAFWADIPFVYRVHEEPDSEKMDSFKKFIGNFGLYMKGRQVYPKDLQQILDEVKDTDNEVLVATHMLRSLMKAAYAPECMGHFGLAAKYYCHFTSPIRRYPDLIIHRILKDFIDGKNTGSYQKIVGDAARQSSEAEKEAELCERDVTDLFKTAYISNYIGAEFPAKVSGVTKFGIFAELENSIEGLIRLESIDGDYYEYNDDLRALVGTRHGRTYKIGDSINIEVVGADLLSRNIDFVLKGTNFSPLRKFTKSGLQKSNLKSKAYKRGRKNG